MPTFDYDFAVIGGGAAGLTAAAGAAKLGARTLLIEKDQVLGGDCLHYGCVPSKTLIHIAKVRHFQRTAQRFGLPECDLPPVDFRQVAARIRKVIATIQPHDSPERFCSLGVKVLFGAPSFVDDHCVSINGTRVSAAKWLIATGSSPAVPDLPGLRTASYLTNRDIFSLPRLPQSLIILGGGAIAVEMAQAFQRLGSQVSIVQRSPQLLSREDPDMASIVADRLRAEGLALHLGVSVLDVAQGTEGAQSPAQGADETGGHTRVRIADVSGQSSVIRGEALLVAMGRTPNVAGLALEKAGVAHDAKGVPTDARLRTTRPHIFAAGDVLGVWQFTHAAGYEAGVALANAVIRLPRRVDYTRMPRVTYSEPGVGGIGLTERAARAAGIEYTVHTQRFADNDRAQTQGAPEGLVKMLLDRREKVIGVHICGPDAGELLNEWVAVLGGKVTLSALAQAVHPYPTLGEINKRLAGEFLAPKIFTGLLPKALKIIFGLRGRACGGASVGPP